MVPEARHTVHSEFNGLKRRCAAMIRGCSTLACMIIASTCLFLAGCQPIQSNVRFPWESKAWSKPVDHIMAVWTDAVRHETGKPSERGFGGRLVFYSDTEVAQKVSGVVTIFVFSDDVGKPADVIPDMKFVFPAEVLDDHYSKCPLGHSYSFWIPLCPLGTPSRQYSLVARLDPPSGSTVVSQLAVKVLPGTQRNGPKKIPAADEPQREAKANASGVQQVGYEETEPDDATTKESPSTFRTDTIDVTPEFARRLNSELPEGKNEGGSSAAVTATSASAMEPAAPSNGSRRSESQAPSSPSTPPTVNPPRRQPHPAGWLNSLPPTPRSGIEIERPAIVQSRSSLSRRAEQWFRLQAEKQSSTEDPAANSEPVSSKDD